MTGRNRSSARLRIVVMTIAVVAVSLTVFLVVLRQALHADVDDRGAASLEQEANEFSTFLDEFTPVADESVEQQALRAMESFLIVNVVDADESLTAIVGGRARLVTQQAPADLRPFVEQLASVEEAETFEFQTTAGAARVLAQPMLDEEDDVLGVLAIAWFADDDRARVDDTVRTALGVALIALVVAAILIWVIAGRLLRPVRQLAAAAQEITETRLDRRLPPEGPAEMATLTASFNQMVDRLDDALTQQRRFLDDAGHELRTPITIMRGHLDVAADDPTSLAESRPIIEGELARMQRIVDDLLTLARAEQVDFLRRHPVDVDEFTATVCERAASLTGREVTIDEAGVGVVDADAERLTQAILNLVVNADRHTPRDGAVAVGSRVRDRSVEFWVRDTGEGIAPSDHGRVFERFARPSATRSPGGSAGLGLSIVRAVADAHGGTVRVDSALGAGATFTITLPMEATR